MSDAPNTSAAADDASAAADPAAGQPAARRPSDGEVVHPDQVETGGHEVHPENAVTEPAKVMRIGGMVKQLLEEVRSTELDDASRERLAEVYERSVVELAEALSPDLQEELRQLALPFDHDEVPSGAELRVAKAQLVGWLEGLFHGIQATLMAQQFAARQQLQQMRQLPGAPGQPGGPNVPQGPGEERPGTYL